MTQEPSLPKQAQTFVKTAVDVVKGFVTEGELLVTEEEKNARLEICKTCSWFDANSIKCNECGCWLNQNASFSEAHCPIDLW